jgi:hypothetical protein
MNWGRRVFWDTPKTIMKKKSGGRRQKAMPKMH